MSLSRILSCIVTGAFFFAVAGAYLGNWAISAAHGGIILGLIVGGIMWFRGNRVEEGSSFTLPLSLWSLAAIAAFALVSMIGNWDDYSRPLKDLKKLRYLLIPVALFAFPWSRKYLVSHAGFLLTIAFRVLVVTVTIVTLASFVGLLTGFHPLTFSAPSYDDRISGVFGLSLSFANSLILTLLVLIGVIVAIVKNKFQIQRWHFWILTGIAFLLVLGVYFSMSRGAILALCAGLAVMAISLRSKVLIGTLAIGVVLLIGVSLATNNIFVKKLQYGIDSIRIAQWKAASLTFLDHPTIGVGFRQFEKQCGDLKLKYSLPEDQPLWQKTETGEFEKVGMKRMNSHAHNNYLEAFASTGVFGGLAFLAFVGFWFREMNETRLTSLIFAPAVVAFAVAGFFENTFTDSEVLHWIVFVYIGSQLFLSWEKSNPDFAVGSRN